MSEPANLVPVVLPSWPTCDDCVSWSEDALAVAGGETVYILTAKSSISRSKVAGHPQWHIFNLRVNQFQYAEWPEQILAPIEDLSIGEEQSNSDVVALSWSNSGLGKHRRAVLAVLTSNLVLSFWETDGSETHWQRTCVFNRCPGFEALTRRDKTHRRAGRVRSFAWLPALHTVSLPKRGLYYLAVTNDIGEIVVLRVSRFSDDLSSPKGWTFDVELKLGLEDLNHVDVDINRMSPLQLRLHQQSPITKIRFMPWSKVESQQTRDGTERVKVVSSVAEFVTNVLLTKGTSVYSTSIRASVSTNDGKVVFDQVQDENHIINDRPSKVTSLTDEYFKDTVQPLRDEFDHRYQLFGHSRVRHWGSTISPDGAQAVVCVTFHPSDMIEYTIPSAEKCTLAFKTTGYGDGEPPRASRPHDVVQKEILSFANGLLRGDCQVDSLFDRKLRYTYTNLATILLDPASAVRRSFENLTKEEEMQGGENDTSSLQQIRNQPHVAAEDCDICGSSIPFKSDTTEATCTSGHQFSRCQLSFLAIQEPGISKYCSGCGIQFLDLPKLRPIPGPSFTRLIFDQFHICPYCQAKFRG